MARTVIVAALGECVHVAGIVNFLRLAESAGWKTIFLGPAVPINEVIKAAQQHHADLVGVSYRLTPETGERLLGDFAEAADHLYQAGVRFVFGGTPPLAARARQMGFFEHVFQGGESAEVTLAFLKGEIAESRSGNSFPQTTIERILWKTPFPLLRHHFGLPDLEATRQGIAAIAEAGVLDVISLGIDQDAQTNFYHPERHDPQRRGAGGVPVRSDDDYRQLFTASRIGNFPLMRTYSGTDDFIRLAEMVLSTINNAWCAIPLFWFNRMDGRGPWDLQGSILQHQAVMRWYGKQHIPVELNEPHHWGMRDAPDIIFVIAGYLSAYNARQMGVQDYIAQFMFNSPPGTADAMDIAKMLAILELITPLEAGSFRIWRQVRTGLLSYPLEINAARAHLAASIYTQMALKPHIVHVVGHTEADHAATAIDVIGACLMARRSIENALYGSADSTFDPAIQARRTHLIQQAQVTLAAIHQLAPAQDSDPLTDPATLAWMVTTGILDAPHLRNNPYAHGKVSTRIINGACEAIDNAGRPLTEEQRLAALGI